MLELQRQRSSAQMGLTRPRDKKIFVYKKVIFVCFCSLHFRK